MSALQDLNSHLIQRGHVDELTLVVWVALSTEECVVGHWPTGLDKTLLFMHTIKEGKALMVTMLRVLSLTHGAPGSHQHIWTFASGSFT